MTRTKLGQAQKAAFIEEIQRISLDMANFLDKRAIFEVENEDDTIIITMPQEDRSIANMLTKNDRTIDKILPKLDMRALKFIFSGDPEKPKERYTFSNFANLLSVPEADLDEVLAAFVVQLKAKLQSIHAVKALAEASGLKLEKIPFPEIEVCIEKKEASNETQKESLKC